MEMKVAEDLPVISLSIGDPTIAGQEPLARIVAVLLFAHRRLSPGNLRPPKAVVQALAKFLDHR